MGTAYAALKQKVFEAAKECARRGPGYSQQRPVLDAVAAAAGANTWTRLDLAVQQAILTCWHDLFREGALSWGYDLDNPDASRLYRWPSPEGRRFGRRKVAGGAVIVKKLGRYFSVTLKPLPKALRADSASVPKYRRL